MKKDQKLLSDIVVYNKYAKYVPALQRRETWDEIIDRYLNMMIKKYPLLKKQINKYGTFLRYKYVLPSMRALQFAGPAIEKNESRVYNCSFLPITDYRAFSELMFLLLGGTGVGYSIQKHHIAELPSIQHPTKVSKFLIGDSIEGWSDAIRQLMKAYFGIIKVRPRFDYSDIRPKGARLVTAGGKAPGPGPLKICLTKIETVLNAKQAGSMLSSFEVHRICCLIADAVLSGGIRRAALIALFSFDDIDMATCKHGQYWEKFPELGRANNSAVILRNRVLKEEFYSFWENVMASNTGEPGVYFTNDPNYGVNPCVEISLRPFTFCNLTEVNVGLDYTTLYKASGSDRGLKAFKNNFLHKQVKVASFFGTLQAGFTDFHYLRAIWKTNTAKDSLIGVGMTGIASNNLEGVDLKELSQIVKDYNKTYSKLIGIHSAARTTTVKPSGSTSCVVGSSSGVHAWHSKYYIRNMQCAINSNLYNYFKENHPSLVTPMKFQPADAVIGIPQKAPENAILRRTESSLELLHRIAALNVNWVYTGHRRGPNKNNVSATISIKEHEWQAVRDWMWDNKDKFSGLSVLPYDGGIYENAPFIECTEAEYNEKIKYIKEHEVVLSSISEKEDNTIVQQTIACAGNSCEIV